MSKIGGRAAHFLAQKPWTPWNPMTKKTIWEAEQKAKEQNRREDERAELVKRQADIEAQSRMVTALGGDRAAIGSTSSHPLHFMYSVPPGLNQGGGGNREASAAPIGGGSFVASAAAQAALDRVNEKQEVDLDGGDEVRRFMAAFGAPAASSSSSSSSSSHSAAGSDEAPEADGSSGAVSAAVATAADSTAEGAGEQQAKQYQLREQSALEKLAGKRAGKELSIEDQAERFPMLKNAPVESFARTLDTRNLNFKPLGMVLRNVRCLRCKAWGHETGDRECPLREVINPKDLERQLREDPLAHHLAAEAAIDETALTGPLPAAAGSAVPEAPVQAGEWGGVEESGSGSSRPVAAASTSSGAPPVPLTDTFTGSAAAGAREGADGLDAALLLDNEDASYHHHRRHHHHHRHHHHSEEEKEDRHRRHRRRDDDNDDDGADDSHRSRNRHSKPGEDASGSSSSSSNNLHQQRASGIEDDAAERKRHRHDKGRTSTSHHGKGRNSTSRSRSRSRHDRHSHRESRRTSTSRSRSRSPPRGKQTTTLSRSPPRSHAVDARRRIDDGDSSRPFHRPSHSHHDDARRDDAGFSRDARPSSDNTRREDNTRRRQR